MHAPFSNSTISALSDDTASSARESVVLFFISAFALGQAVQINDGTLHPAALGWIAITLVFLTMALWRRKRGWVPRLAKAPALLLGICLAIQWGEQLFWGIRWCERTVGSIGWFVAAMAIAAIGAAMILRGRATGLAILLLGHAAASYYVIGSQPIPRIDVWHFQQEATTALLRGENPYEPRYRNVYEPDRNFYGPGMVQDGRLTHGFPYPPLTLLVDLPGRLLGDVRWSSVLLMELAAVVLAIAAPHPHGLWAAAMLLLMPRSMLVIKASWTEPLVVLALVATIYCTLHARRWLWLALGLLIASKQYTLLMAPLAIVQLIRPPTRRQAMFLLLKSGAVAAVIALPFFIWNPRAFVQSVVLMQFRQPFRPDSLSFTAMLAYLTGIQIDAGIGFALAGVALIRACQRGARTPAGFAGATALMFMLFFAFNKQAFCNYYYMVFAVCCCAAAFPDALRRQPMSDAKARMDLLDSRESEPVLQ